jgi:hypothetical protein
MLMVDLLNGGVRTSTCAVLAFLKQRSWLCALLRRCLAADALVYDAQQVGSCCAKLLRAIELSMEAQAG